MKLKEMLEASKLKKNITKIVFLTLFVLSLNSLSYAYFTSEVEGKGNEMVLSTSDMLIKFTDSEAIKKTGLTPGSTITKTFTITNNSDSSVSYKINWEYLINNFVGRENLVYEISSNNGGGTLAETQLPDSEEHINILDNLTINTGVTQNYTMTITYKDNGQNQDLDKSKSLIGKIEVTDADGNSILPETSTGSSSSPITTEKNLYGLKMKDLVNVLYPVGSEYKSLTSDNPSEIMGGSWEKIKKSVVDTGWQEYTWSNSDYINTLQTSYTINKWRVKDNILYIPVGVGATNPIDTPDNQEIARIPIINNSTFSLSLNGKRVFTGAVGEQGATAGFYLVQNEQYLSLYLKPHASSSNQVGRWYASTITVPLDDSFAFVNKNFDVEYTWKRIS